MRLFIYYPVSICIAHRDYKVKFAPSLLKPAKQLFLEGLYCLCVVICQKHILSLLGGLMQAQRWDDSGTLPQQNLHTLLLSIAKGYRRLPAAQHAQRLFHHWMEADGKTQ